MPADRRGINGMAAFNNVLLIVNPTSGMAQGNRAGQRLGRRLLGCGMACTERRTAGPGDALRWANEAGREGFDLVMAVGGDGTLQEVVAGMATAAVKVPIGHLPVGTANVVALALALPYSTRLAFEVITGGKVLPFDVGFLPELDRYFILMAAIGYPARIIQDSPRRSKKLFGFLTYLAAGFRHGLRVDHARMHVTADGVRRSFAANTLLVANIGRFEGWGLRVSPRTSPHDGRFDVSIISSRSLLDVIKILFRMLTWRYRPTRRLRHFQARRVIVSADPPVPVQIDGENLGSTPLVAEIRAAAVDLLVPMKYQAK
jgi:diacylglycerol kinase (ATP)